MIEKKAKTQVPINDLIAQRWSGRAYNADKPVSQQQLITIIEAARWAPSCFGDEPWRYIIWDRFQDPAGWQQAFDCLVEGNQSWAKDAPVLMLSLADTVFTQNGKPNRWAQHDTGAASENICLQATALGLMAHQMGGFDSNKISATFSIPDQFTCLAMITLGYQANIDDLDAASKDRETEARTRADLSQRFFFNKWNNPFTD